MSAGDVFGPLLDLWQSLQTKWQVRTAKINIDAKCPACGHRKGHIEYMNAVKPGDGYLIQHNCHVCSFTWGEPTIVELSTDANEAD